jgi:hypothetical protein
VDLDLYIVSTGVKLRDAPFSQVGIMFNRNGQVENVMIGSPAYTSRNIFKGDFIVKVDGEFVEKGNDLQQKIVGDDTPGSFLTLTIKRGPADLIDVTMKRISTEEVADKRRMFDLFTALHDRAKKDHDVEAGKHVEETLLLWEKMLNAEFETHQHIAENVQSLQRSCLLWSEELSMLVNNIGQRHGWQEDFPEQEQDSSRLVNDRDVRATRAVSLPFRSPNMPQSSSQKRPEGKDIVGYCEFLCTLLEEAFCNDILSVPTESISAGFTSKSTVGIMLVGMVIDNMVVGGEIPAPKSLSSSYHAPTRSQLFFPLP